MSNKMNKLIQNGTRVLGNQRRTSFPRTDKNYVTFNAGKLVPIFCKNMEPYQRWSVKQGGAFVRALTPLTAVMDSAYLDLFVMFCPNRLVWDHWEDFITGVNQKDYTSGITYAMPKIKFKADAYSATGINSTDNRYIHSFLDYLPRAVDVCELSKALNEATIGDASSQASYLAKINEYFAIDAIYPRAMVKIWNDWFRDEFLDDAYELYTGDNDEYATEFAFDLLHAGTLPKVNKLHTLFTDARPEPYNGTDTLIPMDNLQVGFLGDYSGTLDTYYGSDDDLTRIFIDDGDQGSGPAIARNVSNTIRQLGVAYKTEYLLQKDLTGGNRYVEQILTHWGISNSDRGMNRSQFVDWRRIGLDTYQITNTAQSAGAALGNVGGQQVIRDSGLSFAFEAPEHGTLWVFACFRTNLSLGASQDRSYKHYNRFDYHWPEFNHVGYEKLYTEEVDTNAWDNGFGHDAVFGYVPYGERERVGIAVGSGLFRYKADGNLTYMTYQEVYDDDSGPILSDDYIAQSMAPVAQTQGFESPAPTDAQFYGYFQFDSVNTLVLDPTSQFSLRI